MTFQNNNKAIIKHIAKRSINSNKLRNIFIICAITLTTLLFTTLFTVCLGMANSFQQQTMRQSGGYAHGSFKYIDFEKYDKIKEHPLIKEIGYSIVVGIAENNELQKRQCEIRYATDELADMFFSYPTTGKMPSSKNECATDTIVLDSLGVPHELGQKFNIIYTINDKQYTKEVTLCGFWDGDEASPSSMIWLSQAFIDNNLDDVAIGDSYDTCSMTADVMFSNSFNVEEKMNTVLSDCGYSNDENNPNYIAIGVNWAYLSTNFNLDAGTIIIVFSVMLLIIFTGYLIIYNIFQISIVKDIRFYGLLKTIGTTTKQIKKLVKRQALILAVIGIPIGLVIGFGIGSLLLPIIMKVSSYKDSYVSYNPLIFIGSTLFSAITVFISCKKPAKIASAVSPIEAVRYTESAKTSKKLKKSKNGGKIHKMAAANILRNKKKTILVVLSMSLSLVLLNSLYTFTNGFDINKYVEKFICVDYVAGNANYFNINQFHYDSDTISEEMIDSINTLDGLEGAGRIYYVANTAVPITEKAKAEYAAICAANESAKNIENIKALTQSFPQLYGLDDFSTTILKVTEGEFNLEKFKTGNYIIEGIQTDDYGKPELDSSHYAIGDKIPITYENGTVKEYEVMAKIELNYSTDVRYFTMNPQLYLPADEFTAHIEKPLTMSYVFNIADEYEEQADTFLEKYTENIDPQMDYESKQKYKGEFNGFVNMFLIVGGTLSFIIGIIGVLNFINAILTSIISRKKEFAMLQSIGMTTKQLNKLLLSEGVFYALATIITSGLISGIMSATVLKGICSELWFTSYHFTITPLLIASPILLIISIIIPYLSYRSTNKQSIVERLQESE